MTRQALVFAFMLTLSAGKVHAGAVEDCAQHLPWGAPSIAGSIQAVCAPHRGYIAFVDLERLVPRMVAYKLTPPFGKCFARQNNFHADDALPAAHRARPADYHASGYDMGHQAPAEDFAGDADQMSESFSMANMAPQLGGLNRQGWERIEEDVRSWAKARGEVEVFVGPALGDNDKTIGPDHVDIPAGFFKVIVDPKTGEAIAFLMPQMAISKADAPNYQVPVDAAESAAGFRLPLPAGVDRAAKPALWAESAEPWCGK